jgi:hypothetical protein
MESDDFEAALAALPEGRIERRVRIRRQSWLMRSRANRDAKDRDRTDRYALSRLSRIKINVASGDPYPTVDSSCVISVWRGSTRPCSIVFSTRPRAHCRRGAFQTGSWPDCPGCRFPPSVSHSHQPKKLVEVDADSGNYGVVLFDAA